MQVSMLSPGGGGRPGIPAGFDLLLCPHPWAFATKMLPQGRGF